MSFEIVAIEERMLSVSELTPQEIRAFIASVEQKLINLPQTELPLQHHFSNGVYAREIAIPPGIAIIGKIHKYQSLNIVSKGEITVLSTDGFKRIKAPATFISNPGVKRLGITHEETVWTTIHATDETDLTKLEEELIAKDYDDVIGLVAPVLEEPCHLL